MKQQTKATAFRNENENLLFIEGSVTQIRNDSKGQQQFDSSLLII